MDHDPLLADLPRALAAWKRRDPVLWQVAREAPPPPRQIGQADPFLALVESLTHQQVSLVVGRAIFQRFLEAYDGTPTADRVAQEGEARLRSAGLSGQKARYVLDLARRVDAGELDLAALAALPDDDVVAALTEVKGVGVWTAQMFLLFHLERPDIMAPGDRGLQLAAAKVYGVDPDQAAAFLTARSPRWAPYRSLACLVLWHARRADART